MSEMTHCVYWTYTDPFNGKTYDTHRNFETEEQAKQFAALKKGRHVKAIKDAPWHPSHGYAQPKHFWP